MTVGPGVQLNTTPFLSIYTLWQCGIDPSDSGSGYHSPVNYNYHEVVILVLQAIRNPRWGKPVPITMTINRRRLGGIIQLTTISC